MSINKQKYFLRSLISIISIYSLSIANASQIQGYIINLENNQKLPGANIILEGTILGTASDENGYYSITNIPIGEYTIKVMFIGFEDLKKIYQLSTIKFILLI